MLVITDHAACMVALICSWGHIGYSYLLVSFKKWVGLGCGQNWYANYGYYNMRPDLRKPGIAIIQTCIWHNAHALLVPQVKKCQSPVFVIFR